MKKLLSVLALLTGLGCSISSSQGTAKTSAFDRYIAKTRAGRSEPALRRLASQCGVALNRSHARFAEMPEESWKHVKRLPADRADQETDFFSTAAVWRSGTKFVVEIWWMDAEAGEETRTLYCLENQEIISGEQIQWVGPEDEESNTAEPEWAYEIRWKIERKKFFKTILERFVDDDERPISKPKLGANAPKTFGLIPEKLRWSDLKLPDEMLH
jgi:hypothetical protein